MRLFIVLSAASLYSQAVFAVLEGKSSEVVRTIGGTDVAKWLGGLIFVLALFFLCVWLVRKAGGFSLNNTQQMRVVGGLALSSKERLVLVQLGDKQLVLGVCPGRIETLHVLEGDDCLQVNQASPKNESFAQKLTTVMTEQDSE